MGKLNAKLTIGQKIVSRSDVTLNEEDGIAFKQDCKTELMLRTMSSFIGENGFYKSGKELDSDLRSLICDVSAIDPEFILKLAVYARTQMYLRTAPIVLVGEYAMSDGRGKVPNARRYITNTIQRVDEITELVAYVMEQNKTRKAFKGKLPLCIKSAVADAFNKFDAYQFAKYNRGGSVTLRDAMFICHPNPKDENQEAVFNQIANESLLPSDTWEVAISTNGSTKEAWEKILPSMGYMAVLRNLRTMLDKKVDMDIAIAKITNPKEVIKSKQFPYRFVSAYKELEERSDSSKILDALSDAMELSVQNIPTFEGKTFVTCDISGSMNHSPSEKSKIKMNEIGCLFGAIMHKKCKDSITSVFGTEHVPVSLSSRDSIFTNMKKLLRQNTHGCGTDAYKVMDWLNDNKIFVDRIVLFSDMQCYSSTSKYRINTSENIYAGLIKYRKNINPKVFIYSFDLATYGTTQFPKDDGRVCLAGGFSDKVLSFIPMFERSRADMLAEIEAVTV